MMGGGGVRRPDPLAAHFCFLSRGAVGSHDRDEVRMRAAVAGAWLLGGFESGVRICRFG